MSFVLDPSTHIVIAPRIVARSADDRTTHYPPNQGGGWQNIDWSGAPLTSTPTVDGLYDSMEEAIGAV